MNGITVLLNFIQFRVIRYFEIQAKILLNSVSLLQNDCREMYHIRLYGITTDTELGLSEPIRAGLFKSWLTLKRGLKRNSSSDFSKDLWF